MVLGCEHHTGILPRFDKTNLVVLHGYVVVCARIAIHLMM